MKVVLHVGMTKTGSTSIQHVLAENREALKAKRVSFTQTMGVKGSQFHLYMRNCFEKPDMLKVVPERYHRWGPHDALAAREFDQRFANEIEGTDTTIISSEVLWEWCNSDVAVQSIVGYLRKWFDQVNVVVYLRRQDLHLTSMWTQVIRTGQSLSFDSFEERETLSGYHNYSDRLGLWANAIGSASITVCPFERGQLFESDVVRDFLKRTEIKLEGRDHFEKRNQRVSAEVAAYLRDLNEAAQHIDAEGSLTRIRKRQMHIMQAFSKNCPVVALSERRARTIIERYEQQNQHVAREYLGRDDGVLFRDPIDTNLTDFFGSIEPKRAAELACLLMVGTEELTQQEKQKLAKLAADRKKLKARVADLQYQLKDIRQVNQNLRAKLASLAEKDC
ncbi:hypothetical protein SLH49_13030 [Cognatiyoonia sp. IB215446]|uniref:hypothetical protein n=1 Tax=Cognatiyoonia sp. IB215446 TaxID=3097355 RepID=UPI002A0E41A9|nr:hypothetical protein [Cognatiyoonia sp. IB215446]MDX8348903.1 hypothetical protein [Cognatiyoonia sp. IB215446]